MWFKLTPDLCAFLPASWVIGLQTHATMPGNFLFYNPISDGRADSLLNGRVLYVEKHEFWDKSTYYIYTSRQIL